MRISEGTEAPGPVLLRVIVNFPAFIVSSKRTDAPRPSKTPRVANVLVPEPVNVIDPADAGAWKPTIKEEKTTPVAINPVVSTRDTIAFICVTLSVGLQNSIWIALLIYFLNQQRFFYYFTAPIVVLSAEIFNLH